MRFITITGGEPCASKHLSDVIGAAIDISFDTTIITNGTIPHQAVIKANESRNLKVVVSILSGTPIVFSKVTNAYPKLFYEQSLLLSHLKSFSLNIPIFYGNCDESSIQQMLSYIQNYREKIEDVSVYRASVFGNNRYSPKDAIQEKKMVYDLGLSLRNMNIRTFISTSPLEDGNCSLNEGVFPSQIFVDPAGRIRPCHLLVHGQTENSLNDSSLKSLLNDDDFASWFSSEPRIIDNQCKAKLIAEGHSDEYSSSAGWSAFIHGQITFIPAGNIHIERDGESYAIFGDSPETYIKGNQDLVELINIAKTKGINKDLFLDITEEDQDSLMYTIRLLTGTGLLKWKNA